MGRKSTDKLTDKMRQWKYFGIQIFIR